MQRLEFRAMGCQMLAVLDTADENGGAQLAHVPKWFTIWEEHLSRFREGSELSQLNRQPGVPTVVSPLLYDVVQAALRAAHETDGLVTPTLLAALEAAGYDRSFEAIDTAAPAKRGASPHRPGSWRDIICDRRRRTIRLPSGMRLDLGGIAKGWAADRAAERLVAFGPALIDAGGDIAVSGQRTDGQPWPVGVTDPTSPTSELELLAIRTGGVATSGRDYRRWQYGGTWQHHILDPRSGRPAVTDVLSATVVGPSATAAEAAAKSVLILGSRDGLAWLDARPTLAGLLVLEDGRLVRSKRLAAYLWR